VDRVEVGERDRDPARVARHQGQGDGHRVIQRRPPRERQAIHANTPTMRFSWLLASAALCAACGTQPKPIPEAPVKDPIADKPQPKPKTQADLFLDECRQGLASAQAILPQILAGPAERTVDNTLARYNELLAGVNNSAGLAGLYSEVHPDSTIREAARTCEQEVSNFVTELQLDRPLFDALAKVDLRDADAETKRFVEHTLRDYRRAGVDRDEATRTRLKQIDDELTKLGQQFAKNISDDVRAIEVDPAQLDGLPQDFKDAHPPGPNGKVRITTDYPDYDPFMTYAKDDALRRELYIKFRSRGDEHSEALKASRGKDNEQLLLDILALRAEKALLLGYPTWADYITEDKMIKSAAKASEFIDRVWKAAARRARRDYDELLRQLRTIDRTAKEVGDWQKTMLESQVKKAKYDVDDAEVRKYFPYEQTLAGLLDITSTIYDIQYVPVADAKVWHEDVKTFDVKRGETVLGRIYLDMHPREGKYKHAAQFPLRDGIAGTQLPEGVLVCNFPNPKTAGGPALMEHDDVVTMFHEFGHLMHHTLGGHHRWIRHSGVATEFDFVEAPSQMFEEWAWNHETLSRFAKHHETGAPIPKALVDKMRKAYKFGRGTYAVQQMFYAAMSLGFHTTEVEKLDPLAELKRLQKKYTPYAYVEGTRFHASFGHLVGYSAMYYTYMWSLVIAKDLLTPFQKKGLMHTETTYKYRDTVIAPGGTRDAADLVKEFLGRDYNFKAFDRFLAE
jgi:thimet oligopeptidase